MSQLKKLQIWISAYEKANDTFPDPKAIKFKVKELLKEDDQAVKSKSKQIFFRESQWSDYNTLRNDLAKDKKFVEDFKGVDLRAYIDDAVAWSEKGNKSTDMGWKLTLKNWMRNAKKGGKLIMIPKVEKKVIGHVNY